MSTDPAEMTDWPVWGDNIEGVLIRVLPPDLAGPLSPPDPHMCETCDEPIPADAMSWGVPTAEGYRYFHDGCNPGPHPSVRG